MSPPIDLSLRIGAGEARIVLVFLLLAVGVWSSVRARARGDSVSRGLRLLLPLRLTALVALAFLLLAPTLVVERTRAVRPRVVVAVDHSLSMTLPAEGEEAGGESRLERAARTMTTSGLLDRLRAEADVEYVTFAGRAHRVDADSLFTGGAPEAGRTDLAAALAWIHAHLPDADAVVVVTDGRVDAGDDPAVELRGGPPTFFVGVGRGRERSDASLSAVRTPARAYEGGPVPFEVTLRLAGRGAVPRRLVVSEGERTVRTIPVEPGGIDGFRDLRFSLTGEPPGRHVYRLRLEGAADDVFPDNDRRMAVVRIEASRTPALVVSGTPRWDVTFFIDALTRLDYLRVDRLLLEPGGTTGRLLARGGAPAKAVPIGEIDPARYRLLCLQGGPIPARLLPAPGSSPLGGADPGIILLLTDPVEALPTGGSGLPPWMPPSLREPARFREGAFEVVAPGEGGAPGLPAGDGAWKSLAPLGLAIDLPPDAFTGEGLSPLLSVTEDRRRFVALARGTRGSTRIVAFLGRGYWRWGFHGAPREGAGSLYRDLIDGLVRWALDSGPGAGRIHVTPAAPLFERDERVEFLRRGTGAPGDRFYLVIESEGGEAPPDSFFFDASPGGRGRISTGPFPPGGWRYEYGKRGEGAVGGGQFTVDAYSREFSDPEPDGRRLAELGALEGVSYVDASEIEESSAGEFVAMARIRRAESANYVIIYGRTAYILILISLISEILLRKRQGFS